MSDIKYCPNCQKEVSKEVTNCTCGYEFVPEKNEEPANVVKKVEKFDPVPGFIWSVVGICTPIVGLVLYFIFKKERPTRADNVKDSSLMGLVIWALLFLFVLFFIPDWATILK